MKTLIYSQMKANPTREKRGKQVGWVGLVSRINGLRRAISANPGGSRISGEAPLIRFSASSAAPLLPPYCLPGHSKHPKPRLLASVARHGGGLHWPPALPTPLRPSLCQIRGLNVDTKGQKGSARGPSRGGPLILAPRCAHAISVGGLARD